MASELKQVTLKNHIAELRQELLRLANEARDAQEWATAQELTYAYNHVCTAEYNNTGAAIEGMRQVELNAQNHTGIVWQNHNH